MPGYQRGAIRRPAAPCRHDNGAAEVNFDPAGAHQGALGVPQAIRPRIFQEPSRRVRRSHEAAFPAYYRFRSTVIAKTHKLGVPKT